LAWTIEFDKKAEKELKKLNKLTQKNIDKFLIKLSKVKNPRDIGKSLKGKLGRFWRYRVGDYRLICTIEDKTITILVLAIGHRREVYK
jgi:mRNA interferase RelE/StbE